jgi:hypothetical protein
MRVARGYIVSILGSVFVVFANMSIFLVPKALLYLIVSVKDLILILTIL